MWRTTRFLFFLTTVALDSSYAQALQPSSGKSDVSLRVLFQGDDRDQKVLRYLEALKGEGLLAVKSHELHLGETAQGVYSRALQLGGTRESLSRAAKVIGGVDIDDVTPGDSILYPDVIVDSYRTHRNSYLLNLNVGTDARWESAVKVLNSLAIPDAIPLPKTTVNSNETSRIVVRVEGGDIENSATSVLEALLKESVIRLVPVKIEKGDTIEGIYQKRLGIPVSFVKLASALNKVDYGADPKADRFGENLLVPDATFTQYVWNRRLNLDIRADRDFLPVLRTEWTKFIVSERPIVEGKVIDFQLRGYELKVYAADLKQLDRAYRRLAPLRSTNVTVFPPNNNFVDGAYFSDSHLIGEVPIDKFCDAQPGFNCPAGAEQGYVAAYLGTDGSLAEKRNCEKSECPEVILVDQEVKKHANLSFRRLPGHDLELGDLVEQDAAPPDSIQVIKIPEIDDNNHGTHLAGIISARKKGFGIIGIDPDADLYAINWDTYKKSPEEFTAMLEDRKSRSALDKIYVMASNWPWSKPDANGQCFVRAAGDSVARMFVQHQQLMVVAAGNGTKRPNGDVLGDDLVLSSATAPQNLGDCPTVLVVTACSKCSAESAEMPAWANYSSTRRLVHVAARGQSVFSTAGDANQFARMDGTSQSAALVAGLASAMMHTWFSCYRGQAPLLKFRIQQTSTPALTGQQGNLAAGIVNADLALKNPKLHLLQGEEGDHKEVKEFCWSTDKIELYKSDPGQSRTIPVEKVYRLYCRQQTNCSVYWAESDERNTGMLARSGPGMIKSQGKDLFRADGKSYNTAKPWDLALANSVSRRCK